MKRSEMIELIKAKMNFSSGDDENDVANRILMSIEEAGMLPPTQAPSLVPDTYNGHGTKHGPCQRVWDDEYDSGAEMDRQMAVGGQVYPAECYEGITKEEWQEAQDHQNSEE